MVFRERIQTYIFIMLRDKVYTFHNINVNETFSHANIIERFIPGIITKFYVIYVQRFPCIQQHKQNQQYVYVLFTFILSNYIFF